MSGAASIPIQIVVDPASIKRAISTTNAQLATIGQGNGAAGAQTTIQRLTMSLGVASNGARQAAANSNIANSAFGSLGASAQAAAQRLTGMGGSLASIGFAGAALGATAVIGALVGLGTAAVNASSQMQSYRASLSTVLGDMDKAGMAMDRLTDFAAKTPFSLNQAVEGFIKLKALGLQPSEEAMMSYGNTASALGKDLNQMVEAVADAATGEFERLKEFGIKSKNQGDTVAFTFQGITTTVKNSSDDIQKYLMAIGNTQFAGAMEKQMGTFNGAVSNLQDTWFQTMAAIGDGGLTDAVGDVIKMITNGLTTVTPILVAIGNVMAGVINGVASIASGLGGLFAGVVSNGGQGLTFVETLTLALNVVGQTAEVVGNVIGAVFGAMGTVIGGVITTVKGWFAGLWEYLGVTSTATTQGIGLSFIGILRAAKYLTENLPKMFSAALGAIGGAFSVIGKRIAAFFSGDWSAFEGIGGELKAQFGGAAKVISGIAANASAIARDSKGAAAAFDKLVGRTGKKGGLSLSELAGAAPKPTPTAGKDDDGKKAAERAKRENDFWQSLKDQAVAAGMLSNEAEVYNKGLELRRILERDLTATEQQRIATALGEINTAKAITTLKQAQRDAAIEYSVEAQRAFGLTDQQRAVEDQLYKYRIDAKKKGVDIDSAAYKQAEADLKTQLDKNAALKAQNDLLAKAGEIARKYSPALDAAKQLEDIGKERSTFLEAWTKGGGVIDGQVISTTLRDAIIQGMQDAADRKAAQPILDALQKAASAGSLSAQADSDRRNATLDYNEAKTAINGNDTLTPEDRARQLREIETEHTARMLKADRLIADDFVDKLTDGISEIGKLFGGVIGDFADKLTDVLDSMSANADGTSGIAKLLGKIDSSLGDGFKLGAQNTMNLGKGLSELGDPLKSLKDGFTGPKGSIVKGIGQAIGGAMQGFQIGSAIGDFGTMLGANKGFSGGAKIGGALGGITGNPIIAAAASAVGGSIGSLLYKPKYATASLTGMDPATITGNKDSYKAAAGTAAGSVQAGLADIAKQLGGTVGAFSVAIGQWDGKWRVNDDATNEKLHYNNFSESTLHNFGDDSDAAISYAIANAIKDGAITGISDFAKKALAALDPDAAISLVGQFKSITDELDAMTDPIGAAVRNINTPLDALIKQMKDVGAGSEDLAKMEEYRSKKLDQILKEQLSSLTDFEKSLKGAGGTKMTRLQADLAEFADYQTKIAGGASDIDQSAFTALGQEILGLSSDVYGQSTSEAANIRDMLLNATTSLASNVTNAFNDAKTASAAAATDSTSAIQAAEAARAADAARTNEYLRLIYEGQQSYYGSNSGGVGGGGYARDGYMRVQSY